MKKKNKSGGAAAIMAVCVFIHMLMLSGCDGESVREQSTDRENYTARFCVVLDAGHGGVDGGALGISTGTREAEINLAVTLKTGALLESAGVRVVYTRKGEKSLCPDEQYNKKQDMRLRGQVIDAARPDIVVSVHMNSYPDLRVRGAQTFYYPDSECGKELAESIQRSLKMADPNNRRTVKAEDFFLLRTYAGPSALVECGFMTCPEEEKLLQKQEYQEKLAYCIFDGIMRYLMRP